MISTSVTSHLNIAWINRKIYSFWKINGYGSIVLLSVRFVVTLGGDVNSILMFFAKWSFEMFYVAMLRFVEY